MKRLKIICIFIVGTLMLYPCLVVAQDDDGEDKYGREMYTTPEEGEPGTYNPWSSYEGLISERMLKKIQKLNKKSLEKIKLEKQPELEKRIELPELSEMFGREVSMKFGKSSENVLPQGVSMEELAEAIVKKLIELRKENKVKGVKETHKKEKESGAVEEGEGKTTAKGEKSNKKSSPNKATAEYKKNIEIQESEVTLTYLIFGKKVIIKAPKILAHNFEEKENRLKKEIELMAILLKERRKK